MPSLICEALSRPGKLPQAQAETLAREDVLNSPRARTALQNELEILRAATPGGRNDQLNKSAFNLGQLIGSGELDEWEVVDGLTHAALSVGLGTYEIEQTLYSGVQAGKANPRTAPRGATQILSNVLSQDGIALAAAGRLAGKIKFMRDSGKWHFWDGTRWQLDRFAIAYETARDLARQANHGNRPGPGSAGFVKGAVEHMSNDPEIKDILEKFDSDPWAINTPAGLIDLRSGEIAPHDPTMRITKITTASPARQVGGRFSKFIDEITLGDTELARYLQVAMGATLGGSSSSHWLLFFIGNGRNGKSLLLETIASALGDYATDAPDGLLMARTGNRHPTEFMTLRGARLVVASEIDEGQVWSTSLLKKLTGDEVIKARYVNSDFVDVHRTYKIVIAANTRPSFVSLDTAIQSRLKVVPFNACFEGREDPELPEHLKTERGIVLRWLLDGHRMWRDAAQRLPACAAVEVETESYYEDQSTPTNFIQECCEALVEGLPKAEWASATVLYQGYERWAKSRGKTPVGATRFGEELRKQGFKKSRTNKGFVYPLRVTAAQWEADGFDETV